MPEMAGMAGQITSMDTNNVQARAKEAAFNGKEWPAGKNTQRKIYKTNKGLGTTEKSNASVHFWPEFRETARLTQTPK